MLKLMGFTKNTPTQATLVVEGEVTEVDKLIRDLVNGPGEPVAKGNGAQAKPPEQPAEQAKPSRVIEAPKTPLAVVPKPAATPPPVQPAAAADDDDEDSDVLSDAVAKASKSKEVVSAVREMLGQTASQAAIVKWCTAHYDKIPALTVHGSVETAMERVKRSCVVLNIA
jgi:hypothetical protein